MQRTKAEYTEWLNGPYTARYVNNKWHVAPIAPPDAHKERWYTTTKLIMMCLFGLLIISPFYAAMTTYNTNNTEVIK